MPMAAEISRKIVPRERSAVFFQEVIGNSGA
jgi:hypothetical protein